MDPKAALDIIRDRAEAILNPADQYEGHSNEATELAEACRALDAWLCQGGHLPYSWDRSRIGGNKPAVFLPPMGRYVPAVATGMHKGAPRKMAQKGAK